jgi:hypothetical protein
VKDIRSLVEICECNLNVIGPCLTCLSNIQLNLQICAANNTLFALEIVDELKLRSSAAVSHVFIY